MKFTFVNLYPTETMAQYLLSSYLLKAYLHKFWDGENKPTIDVLNFSTDAGTSEICEEIIKSKPDYLGYSAYVWNIEKILDLVEILRGRLNSIHILGGPEISLGRISSLSDPALGDYYVIGEGERRLLHLLRFLEGKNKGLNLDFPKGVARWNDNRIAYEEDTDRITNLDEIPSVYLNGVLDERLYARQQAFIETQRGCRFKCKYCVYHKNLASISYYSLRRIFDELEYLIVKKQIMALRILDAIFPSDLNRANEIVKYLLELKTAKKVRLPWIFWEFRYHGIGEEFIRLTASLKNRAKILNTYEISPLDRPQFYSDMLNDYTVISSVGVESCYKQALNAVGRPGIDIKKFDAFMNMVREYNIVLKMDLILGLPLETFGSYFQGLEFLLPYFKDTDHVLNIHRLQIIPGCALENLCDKYEIEYSKDAPHLVTSTKSFPQEELAYASKLSAILFRIVNSPLRRQFFDAREQTGKSFYWLIEDIFKRASGEFPKTRLVQNEQVDDVYWNDDIFSEIPSRWLMYFLEKHYITKGALND
jgi:radical SAM superfamily enzyme YgiQ (UPF0313 family)